ncbi:MAG: fibronectin type III domain-containing protein [Vicinamibacterales bacterium]
MTSYKLALLAVMVAACVSCGGSGEGDNGGSPTSPSGGGSGSGSGGGGGGSGCTRPSAPGNLAAMVSSNNAVFTWSPVGGVIDYQVLVGPSPGTSTVMSTNTTHTSYNWNGISRGTYYVRVEARNSCGSSPSSNEVSFTIN